MALCWQNLYKYTLSRMSFILDEEENKAREGIVCKKTPLSLIYKCLCRKQGENKAAILHCSGQGLGFTPDAINESKAEYWQIFRNKPIAMPGETFLPSQWSAAATSEKIYRGFIIFSPYTEIYVSPIHLGFFPSLCNIYLDAWQGGGERVLWAWQALWSCTGNVLTQLFLARYSWAALDYLMCDINSSSPLQAGHAGRSCQMGRASPISLPFAEPGIRHLWRLFCAHLPEFCPSLVSGWHWWSSQAKPGVLWLCSDGCVPCLWQTQLKCTHGNTFFFVCMGVRVGTASLVEWRCLLIPGTQSQGNLPWQLLLHWWFSDSWHCLAGR